MVLSWFQYPQRVNAECSSFTPWLLVEFAGADFFFFFLGGKEGEIIVTEIKITVKTDMQMLRRDSNF